MHRAKKKVVSFKNDFAPWQQKTITDTDRHFEDSFASLSLYHSTHSAQEFAAKVRNSTLMVSLSELQASKETIKDVKIHSKTLSVIKDYWQKKTEQSKDYILFKKKSKSADLITKRQGQNDSKCQLLTVKKASIVDLSRSLNQQLMPAKKQKISKTSYGCRILKIKSQLRNEKINLRKKMGRHENQSGISLQPQSHSLPIRRLTTPHATPKVKISFPKHNFGQLLTQYLSKV